MTWLQIVVLAVLQGLTEFLPVSSSAHLVLVNHFTAWSDQGLAFDAAVHVGTLLAVMLYFRADLIRLFRSAAGRGARNDRRLLLCLLVATLPALIVGALASGWIELWLRSPLLIAVTTIGFGLVLGLVDRIGRKQLELEAVRPGPALTIGLAQVLALVPGTSRSGITISAALALGYTREAAARFSFLLSMPIIAAAGAWGFIQGLRGGGSFELLQFVVAASVSAGVAWITIALFMAWLTRFGLLPFVLYRVLLGLWLLFWFWPSPG
ncbi:MAG: undecaprenyl-diphosphate phosphatase [Pseudomonadota bacterium]